MTIHHQNKHGDFVFSLAFMDQDGKTVEPPRRLDIRLTTPERAGTFVAEFNSEGTCTRCKKVPGGINVFVSLSRNYIGAGRMIVETVSYIQDENFPGGERRGLSKTSTPVFLWDGPSDGDLVITGTIVL
jgi:hypothetical protein